MLETKKLSQLQPVASRCDSAPLVRGCRVEEGTRFWLVDSAFWRAPSPPIALRRSIRAGKAGLKSCLEPKQTSFQANQHSSEHTALSTKLLCIAYPTLQTTKITTRFCLSCETVRPPALSTPNDIYPSEAERLSARRLLLGGQQEVLRLQVLRCVGFWSFGIKKTNKQIMRR